MKTIKNTIILALTLFTVSCTTNETIQELESRKSFKAVYVTIDNYIVVDGGEYWNAWDYTSNTPIENQFVSIHMNENINSLYFRTDVTVTDIIINGEHYGFFKNIDNSYVVEIYNLEKFNDYRGYINFELIYLNE